MTNEGTDTFFTENGRRYSPHQLKKNVDAPFKDHVQFPLLIDILSRKNAHHALLITPYSTNIRQAFLEAFLLHLSHENVPATLHNTELLSLDIKNLSFVKYQQATIEKDFQHLRDTLDGADRHLIIVLNNTDLISPQQVTSHNQFFYDQLDALLLHPNCRFIVFSNTKDKTQSHRLDDQFSTLHIQQPNDMDMLNLLKLQRTELENFHHVVIPEELLNYAYALAERYLSAGNTLENALLLLDSSAARTAALERIDINSGSKPALSAAVMAQVLSGWTQIPATHLSLNKFKPLDFTQGIQQRLFGQDMAVTLLSNELQQTFAQLQPQPGPFYHFLFAGPKHTGKRTAAIALVEQLFKQLNILYFAQVSPTQTTLATIKLQRCLDNQYFNLKDVISQTPFAVIMFEDIEQAPTGILNSLQDILTTGYLHDEAGNHYAFHQAMLLFSTTVGSARLLELAEDEEPEEDRNLDLMQLLMNEHRHDLHAKHQHYSPQELAASMLPDITAHLPALLCQHIVPFLPLNKAAIEKIIRLKLKVLGKQLDARYGVELSYAPEVIRYLANSAALQQGIDTALSHLYFCVEQAVLSQADNKNRPHQLFLQLNETGQLLRCDWLSMPSMREHQTA